MAYSDPADSTPPSLALMLLLMTLIPPSLALMLLLMTLVPPSLALMLLLLTLVPPSLALMLLLLTLTTLIFTGDTHSSIMLVSLSLSLFNSCCSNILLFLCFELSGVLTDNIDMVYCVNF